MHGDTFSAAVNFAYNVLTFKKMLNIVNAVFYRVQAF
jgi:hypothetical protein